MYQDFQLVCPNPFSCFKFHSKGFNIKSGIKDANPFIPSPQMKLIWVLPENRGQNNNFRPNRVKPSVHRSTGDRVVQHYRSTGSVHTGRPVSLQSGRPVDISSSRKLTEISSKTCKSSPKSQNLKGQPLDPGSRS